MYYYLALLWLKQQSRTSELAAFDHSGNVFSEPSILKKLLWTLAYSEVRLQAFA